MIFVISIINTHDWSSWKKMMWGYSASVYDSFQIRVANKFRCLWKVELRRALWQDPWNISTRTRFWTTDFVMLITLCSATTMEKFKHHIKTRWGSHFSNSWGWDKKLSCFEFFASAVVVLNKGENYSIHSSREVNDEGSRTFLEANELNRHFERCSITKTMLSRDATRWVDRNQTF